MPSDVSTTTIQSEGYSPEDWLPYLFYFEENEYLSRDFSDRYSLKQYLSHSQNRTGGNPSYSYIGDLDITIYLEYSPYLRSEHQKWLEGEIWLNTDQIQKPIPNSSNVENLDHFAGDKTKKYLIAQLLSTAAKPTESTEAISLEVSIDVTDGEVQRLVSLLTSYFRVLEQNSPDVDLASEASTFEELLK